MLYIDTHAMADALSRSSKSPYVFRSSATSWQLGEPLGEWAARNGQTEYFVSHVDDSFGAESADAFVAGLQKNGGKATNRVAFANGGDWAKAIGVIAAQSTRNVYPA